MNKANFNSDGYIDQYIVRQSIVFGSLRPNQREGLRELLRLLVEDKEIVGDLRWLAYVLATARHETAYSYRPITERGTPRYFIERYWSNVKVRTQLGNVSQRDATLFCGRGYVQVTGRRNYTLFEKRLKVPLIARPELANDPAVAARIMCEGMKYGLFTGKKLEDYLNRKGRDFVQARRIVNGLDCAEKIAYDAERMMGILKEIDFQL